jgi:hypothetical protein
LVCTTLFKVIEPGMWRERISKVFTANSNNFKEGPLAQLTAHIIHINFAFHSLSVRPLVLVCIPNISQPKMLHLSSLYPCRSYSLSILSQAVNVSITMHCSYLNFTG